MDPGYKKIIPSQARGLGALLAPQSDPGAKPLICEKQYSASASV